MMLPMAITVAGDDPEMAAKKIQAITEAMASPPVNRPTKTFMTSTESAGNRSLGHDVAGQDEEWNAEEDEVIQPVKKLLDQGGERSLCDEDQVDGCCGCQDQRDRHAQAKKADKTEKEQGEMHLSFSPHLLKRLSPQETPKVFGGQREEPESHGDGEEGDGNIGDEHGDLHGCASDPERSQLQEMWKP